LKRALLFLLALVLFAAGCTPPSSGCGLLNSLGARCTNVGDGIVVSTPGGGTAWYGNQSVGGGTVVLEADGGCATSADAGPCSTCTEEACCAEAAACAQDAAGGCTALDTCIHESCPAECPEAP
jgi:hypothetical protein